MIQSYRWTFQEMLTISQGTDALILVVIRITLWIKKTNNLKDLLSLRHGHF